VSSFACTQAPQWRRRGRGRTDRVQAAGRGEAAVRVERERIHLAAVAHLLQQARARLRIPEPPGAVEAGAAHVRAGLRARARQPLTYPTITLLQQACARLRVPQPPGAVEAGAAHVRAGLRAKAKASS